MFTSMEEAFKRVGLVTEEALLEKKAKEEEKHALDRKRVSDQVELIRRASLEAYRLESYKYFEYKWNDEKTHKFIIHLLYAFMPDKFTIVERSEDVKGNCCICGKKLISSVELNHSCEENNLAVASPDTDACMCFECSRKMVD